MSTGLTSFQTIDATFEKTAREIFDAIKPHICLIGEWDDHFSNIAGYYQWSVHKPKVPNTLGADVSLIVTNSQGNLKRILERAHPYTAVLVYDEDKVIPLDVRTGSDLPLVCYLNSVSNRFIRGHVRILLQLQKYFITLENGIPVIVTKEGARSTIGHVFAELDLSTSVDVNCDQLDTFYSYFSVFAELTQYESPVLVDSPSAFSERVKRKTGTVILRCRKPGDKAKYLKLPLKKYFVVFVHQYRNQTSGYFDLLGIGRGQADYYLTAYFLSLQYNLNDSSHQTKFIQIGDIHKVIEEYPEREAFCRQIQTLLSGSTLRFRNIAPKINNVDFSGQSMPELMQRLEKAIYGELFVKCDNTLEIAEMLSGISYSTLHAKK